MRNNFLLRIHQALVRQSMNTLNKSSGKDNVISYRSLLHLCETNMKLYNDSPSDIMFVMNTSMCISIAKTMGKDCKSFLLLSIIIPLFVYSNSFDAYVHILY